MDVLPHVVEWEDWYKTTGRQYLIRNVQEAIDLHLHFLRYTLLRLKVCIVLPEHNTVAGFKILSQILPSISYIVRSWLSAVEDHQVWKSSYKFYFEISIISLFDIWQQIHDVPEYRPLTDEYSLAQLCQSVLDTAKRQERNGHGSAVEISELGITNLERMWNATC